LPSERRADLSLEICREATVNGLDGTESELGTPGFLSSTSLCSFFWSLPLSDLYRKNLEQLGKCHSNGYYPPPPWSREGRLCGALLKWTTCHWRCSLVMVSRPQKGAVLSPPPAVSRCSLLKTSMQGRSLSFPSQPPTQGPLTVLYIQQVLNRCSRVLDKWEIWHMHLGAHMGWI